MPDVESFPTGTPQSPYGKSKLMVGSIYSFAKSPAGLEHRPAALLQPGWRASVGRYGRDRQGIPRNLMPYIAQVAVGRRDSLAIFGNVLSDEDGTGVRDYIHVMDLADGHVVAMKNWRTSQAHTSTTSVLA
ncbi:NAD-dependent epimerase/dehydratase family protein [Escherichia coli]